VSPVRRREQSVVIQLQGHQLERQDVCLSRSTNGYPDLHSGWFAEEGTHGGSQNGASRIRSLSQVHPHKRPHEQRCPTSDEATRAQGVYSWRQSYDQRKSESSRWGRSNVRRVACGDQNPRRDGVSPGVRRRIRVGPHRIDGGRIAKGGRAESSRSRSRGGYRPRVAALHMRQGHSQEAFR